MKWDRIRFKANCDDYRPITFPPPGPYWCSGEGHNYAILVAYVPQGYSDKEIRKLWPEAEEIDRLQTDVEITYSSRFSKPDWYKES